MRVFLIIFLFLSISMTAQKQSFLNLDSIKAYAEKDSLIKDSLKQVFLIEKWDNKTFNPYKEETFKFPFNLEFNDVFYTSPINKENVITSRYGWRWGRAHRGIDIDLITGDEVFAMLDGKVRYIGYHAGHGRVIIIRHYNGLETVYAHLSRYEVKVNETVTKGQIIGKGGRTGNARGSHIHLETMFKGQHINPEYLFSFDDDRKIKRLSFWITRDWVTPFLHNSKRESKFVYFDSYEESKNAEGIQQKIYVVRKGDTLYDISRKHNIPIYKICKTNSIKSRSTLKIGQKLVLGY
jgi:murein DD-endopeptidase MepM/ murein hydrolase activator NlpD